jgi:hypothetical protein
MDREIVQRIKKLLELAKSPCNEYEAARAAEKAKELLERYNLSLGEVELAAAESAETHFLCPQRPPRYLTVLVHAVETLFDCESILMREDLFGPTCIALCGVPQNVEAAALTLHYLQDSIKTIARGRQDLLTIKRKNSRRMNLKRRLSYYYGAACQIHAAVIAAKIKAKANADANRQAIVLVSRAIAKRHMAEKHPHSKMRKLPSPSLDSRAFLLGHMDGAKIQPHGVHRSLPVGPEAAQ